MPKASESTAPISPVLKQVQQMLESQSKDQLLSQWSAAAKFMKDSKQDCTAFQQNNYRNRYQNVICSELSRVKLNGKQNYIHANELQVGKTNYIMTQGPMVSTLNDLWTLVNQQRVTLIMMLCQLQEHKVSKCSLYWPTTVGQSVTYGNIQIRNVGSVDKYLSSGYSLKVSTLQMSVSGVKGYQTIKHAQISDWPDHGAVPCKVLLKISTVVLWRMAMHEIENGRCPDMPKLLQHLREHRAGAVQTKEQYFSLFESLIEWMKVKHGIESDKLQQVKQSIQKKEEK